MNTYTLIFTLRQDSGTASAAKRLSEVRPKIFHDMICTLAAKNIWLDPQGRQTTKDLRMTAKTEQEPPQVLEEVNALLPHFLDVRVKNRRGEMWEMRPVEKANARNTN